MKRRTKFQKFFAVMLVVVMTATLFATPVAAAPADSTYEVVELQQRTEQLSQRVDAGESIMESVMLEEDADFLLSTQGAPVGMVGFEGPYCLDGYTNETVGITVIFHTPSAVASRLIAEAANPRARMGRAADQAFAGEALAAHDAFNSQLARVPAPMSAASVEVVGSHYMLFNGVFMNVPASMVEAIAALPEVFAVTPSFVYFSMDELANMSEEQLMARERLPVAYDEAYADEASSYPYVDPASVELVQGASVSLNLGTANIPTGALVLSNASSLDYVTVTHSSAVCADGLVTVTVNAVCVEGYDSPVGEYQVALAVVFFNGATLVTVEFTAYINVVAPPADGPYVPHPEFNLGAKELFDIPYIHETIGVTGRGVRVGVLDTGIDYRHPVFEPYLVPTDRYTPGLGYYTLRGANFTNIAGRSTGRGTSPMEGSAGATHTNHGTHVAGTIVAMAPDIELYAFRVLASGVGTQPANSVVRALEYAYYLGLDVVNLSLGNRWNSPWQVSAYAIGVLDLAGIISTNSAGNDLAGGSTRAAGRGGWFSTGGGASASPLGITVGAGQAGGRHLAVLADATINSDPAEISLIGAAGGGWSQDDMAGEFDYVWFNILTLPAGGRTGAGYAAFLNNVRNRFFDGEQYPLAGKVGVIRRGGGEFVTMRDMVEDLGGVAIVVVNNQADNTHLSGTTLNNDGFNIPSYSIRMNCGIDHFGPHYSIDPGVGYPLSLQTGAVYFGNIVAVPTPDLLANFSSAGPLGPIDNASHPATMQIAVDIVAPGVNILSANNVNHASRVDDRPYVIMGGTSMSAPAVAGIVALMLEQFPHANPLEIRSRMMSTARPLADYDGQYSVLEVGAGFIDPIRALTENNFITVNHAVPFAPNASSWGAPDDGYISGLEGGWSYQYMSSVSFGRVDMEYGVPARTVTIPVSIRNTTVGSTWDVSYSLLMPTRELAPPDGNWTLWGPRLNHTVEGVTVEIQQVTNNLFAVHLTHDGSFENRGFAQGYLTFTQGDVVISTPFGAYFSIPPLPAPLEPNPQSVIWRPILSNWITTAYNYGETDPRAFSIVHPGAGWFLPDDVGVLSRSNFSALDFGFIDPNNGPARDVEFYFAPYGDDFEDATLFGTAAALAPGAFTTYLNVVRSVKGGSTWTVNSAAMLLGVFGDATVLDPGAYNLFVRVIHGAGEQYDLVQSFTFVVADERPSIELDYDVFYFDAEDDYVTISGTVTSQGHDLALQHGLVFRPATGVYDAVLDYTRTQLALGNTVIPVEADGAFSFQLPAEEAELDLRVIDGVGVQILPVLIGTIQIGWNWNGPASNMISYFYNFEVAESVPVVQPQPVFSWDIFNNGPGGSPSRPNPGLAVAGTIRMWTQLDGVNTPVYFDAADTIVALDQDGECAMEFVRVGRMWVAGTGWANYFNRVDVDKNGNWEYMNLTITVYGETVNVLLVNALFVPAAADVTVTFVVEVGAVGVYAETTTTAEVPVGEAIPASVIPSTDARTGFDFVGWYPSNPAELAYVTDDMNFTAVFTPVVETQPGVTEIVSVTPGNATVERGGTVTLTVLTQYMPDGAWVDLNVAWHQGLTVNGGTSSRVYVADNLATFVVSASDNAQLGTGGFSVVARTTGDWGTVVMLDSKPVAIQVTQ